MSLLTTLNKVIHGRPQGKEKPPRIAINAPALTMSLTTLPMFGYILLKITAAQFEFAR
jgi:hypothetical protein